MVRAVFIGMPGSGKSAIGRRVANRLGVGFEDTDSLIERSTGRKIAELFELGEAHFRAVESEVVRRAISEFDGILSLGGGAILDAVTRGLLGDIPVVLVDASNDVLEARVTHGRGVRPLLIDDVGAKIARLRDERAALYFDVADVVVDSSAFSRDQTTDVVVAALLNPPVTIPVRAERPYDVIVGRAVAPLASRLAGSYSAALVVASPDVVGLATQLAGSIRNLGTRAEVVTVPRSEDAKSAAVIESLWEKLAQMEIGRDGVVVAVGGGATTDVAGFAAATWLRGVAWVAVPTTLLGMVDAAVGGKTGINTTAGKNLAGAFHSPAGVFADLDVLTTLPLRTLREGMGEVVKCGLIGGSGIVETVLAQRERILDPTSSALAQVAAASIALKARVVSSDLRESGQREILNYGHTLAHALEAASGFTMPHGEAVAVGCVFAAELAARNSIAHRELVELHREAFSAVGLAIDAPGFEREELMQFMRSDKKVRDGVLRFVVLRDVGVPEILTAPDHLDRAFGAIGVK
ncbi:3-dehydroquinate synthase [Arcanobacterium wilhelmae]|uniref:Multifunctional fusion protein n=1 Tax=Arcanobacterium wilhelmae TaxID=1803177 RepID=A0ABT9N8K3_9ACTO|nr:3-dehydroquinate synthase [Arcanobacterium wilhelmae]MDP9800036.1 3-dehydroquinate synthase [Arcanobacterium wilhelmae]WFN89531.1 3-dehydroquinate synthase [Arcanobacterium wilhelmae]